LTRVHIKFSWCVDISGIPGFSRGGKCPRGNSKEFARRLSVFPIW
jgi:hypothetical protein